MGSWKKLRPLGRGSFGEVSLASPESKPDSTLIAVKSADVHDWHGIDCLEDEASFLKELAGEPYIVRCFGEDKSQEKDRTTYSLLLEYANGGHLDNLLLRSGRTDATRVAHFTKMLLTGLSRIHAHGIVHCDLKPKNILVFRKRGQIKLKIADFGLALRVSDEREYGHRGSERYSSPESLADGKHGTCTDVWSLGVIVAEMMNPGLHFFDKSYYEGVSLYDQIVHHPLELDRRVPYNFDEYAVDFLEKCVDRDPTKRWSAEELLKHPFITENLSFVGSDDHQIKAENPIEGRSEWVSASNLFATDEDEDIRPLCDLFTDMIDDELLPLYDIFTDMIDHEELQQLRDFFFMSSVKIL